MAYIQEKTKENKIVSIKLKACLGCDANAKQIFKWTSWYPPAELTPAEARKEADGWWIGGRRNRGSLSGFQNVYISNIALFYRSRYNVSDRRYR